MMTRLSVVLFAIIFAPHVALCQNATRDVRIGGYHEFNYGQIQEGVEQWTQAIRVTNPKLRTKVRGDVSVEFQAPGMTRATALCWQQTRPPNPWGQDVTLTPHGIALDAQGQGSFIFPAEQFPHGPVNVRIYAHNGQDRKDIFGWTMYVSTPSNRWRRVIGRS